MNKEDILKSSPESLMSDACAIFDSYPEFKKEYEKKWNIEIECTD